MITETFRVCLIPVTESTLHCCASCRSYLRMLHPLDRLSIAYRQSQRQTRVLAGQANWQRLCVNGRTLACGCCVEELGAKNTRQTSPRNPCRQSVSCTTRLSRKTYSYRHENKLTSIQTCRDFPTHNTRAQTGGRQDSASAQ